MGRKTDTLFRIEQTFKDFKKELSAKDIQKLTNRDINTIRYNIRKLIERGTITPINKDFQYSPNYVGYVSELDIKYKLTEEGEKRLEGTFKR